MITFLQNTLQKHYKWLLSILLAVIIVSFVFTYSASSGISTPKAKPALYYGYDLSNPADQRKLFQATSLSIYLRTGRPSLPTRELEQSGLARGALLYMADEWRIPEPSEAQLIEHIQTLPIFQHDNGSFNQEAYNTFQSTLETDMHLPADFVRDVIAQDWRLQKVQLLLEPPAYTQDFEVNQQFERLHTLWTLEVAALDLKDFTSNITVTQEALESYYKDHIRQYTVPAQIGLSYILFKDKPSAPKAEAQASDCVYAFYDRSASYQSDAFKQILSTYGVSLKKLKPCALHDLASIKELPKAVLMQSANLTEQDYHSDPIVTDDGVYVLFLDSIVPPEQLSFGSAKAQVKEDYIASQKLQAFDAHAHSLTESLQKAHTLEAFKSQAQSLGLRTTHYPTFKWSEMPSTLTPDILTAIQSLNAGSVSNLLPNNNQRLWVFVTQKNAPTIDPNTSEWKHLKAQIEAMTRLGRLQALVQQLIENGLKSIEL